MRQSGYLAACGLYALENNINRLEEDHKKAKEIEETLKSLYFVKKVEEVETNIIIFEINSNYSSEIFINKLQKKELNSLEWVIINFVWLLILITLTIITKLSLIFFQRSLYDIK